MENSYNLNDIEIHDEHQATDLYDEYESVYDDWETDDTGAIRRFTLWHMLLLFVLLILAAVVLVYIVVPYIASFSATPAASQLLPNAVQA